MEIDDLVRHHPVLFHMTAAGAWPAIREHGLVPADRIVATGGFAPDVVAEALGRRTRSIVLEHPVLGRVVLRDQVPLRPHLLAPALDGATVEEWLALLNDRVFLWPRLERLEGLLAARRYRTLEHDVLEVDTAALLAAHGDRVRLSPINSGSALWPNAPRRGPGTFARIADFVPVAGRPTRLAVAEVAVIGGVPDVAAFTTGVRRRSARAAA